MNRNDMNGIAQALAAAAAQAREREAVAAERDAALRVEIAALRARVNETELRPPPLDDVLDDVPALPAPADPPGGDATARCRALLAEHDADRFADLLARADPLRLPPTLAARVAWPVIVAPKPRPAGYSPFTA